MKIVTAHSPEKTEEMQYNALQTGLAECWIRQNITHVPTQNALSDGEEQGLEYVYDEVYFHTTASEDEIASDLNGFFVSGQEWEPNVPMTEKQKIEVLQQELKAAKEKLEESQENNDMAIAELTMVMAAVMGG